MHIFENKEEYSNINNIIDDIRQILKEEYKNQDINFIFKRIVIDKHKFIFKFIIPNKISITISHNFNTDCITLRIKNKGILECELYELKISDKQKFLLKILKYINPCNKLHTITSFYVLFKLLDFSSKIKLILLQRISTNVGKKILNILDESFIKTL